MKRNIISCDFIRNFFFVLVCLFFCNNKVDAQSKLNFGLNQPEDQSTLPRTKAIPLPVSPKPRIACQPILKKLSENEFDITTGWEMAESDAVTGSNQSIFNAEFNTSRWYTATVPGTVLTTLVDQGVYPDPYFGLNNLSIPDSLCRKDWWYRLSLILPEKINKKSVWLIFNGINYKADIWLNGKLLGRMAGAFKRGQFDATPYLKLGGTNILAVHIFPPPNPGIPHEESARTNAGPNGGQLCLDGPTFISSEGWDWIPGIRDRNIGIWQDVRLRLTDAVTISDPQVITDLPLPDTTSVNITIKSLLINHSSSSQKIILTGRIGEIEFTKKIELMAGESKDILLSPSEFGQLTLRNPRLWWPNGYGHQELYNIQLQVRLEGGSLSDQVVSRFGVREFSYDLSVAQPDKSWRRIEFNPLKSIGKVIFDNLFRQDAGNGTVIPRLTDLADTTALTTVKMKSDNPFLVIKINGIPVFCRGGNWGMDDGMKRVSREKMEPYFRLHKDANFNMIRNWTGESTEKVFFDLCDEYGMLVWNDFWLSTEGYNLNVNDNQLFIDNVLDVVKRFRNHPAIAVWCPRNEGYAPDKIEHRLQAIIAREDGTRYYAPNSRNMNLRPSGPWNYQSDPNEYFNKIAEGFNTEIGSPSIPTAATIRSFIPEEDLWPISDAWYYHDLHNGQKDYISSIEKNLGDSRDLDDFCRKAQFVNYDSYRSMFESWNSKMWNKTSGILLWMSHPAWPSMMWQAYSWDYETFGSYYGSKKACEPLHIQYNLHDKKVVIINATLKSYPQLIAKMELFEVSGKKIYEKTNKIKVEANQMTNCFTADDLPNLPSTYLIRLKLLDSSQTYSQNEYWKNTTGTGFLECFSKLNQSKLTSKIITNQEGKVVFVVSNPSKAPVINLKLNVIDKISGKIILPAYFSNGYFSLLPGEKMQVTAEWDHSLAGSKEITAEGLNFQSLSLFEVK